MEDDGPVGGLGQAVVKVQAEITRVESQLLDIRHLRSELVARLEGMRDDPGRDSAGGEERTVPRLPDLLPVRLDRDDLEDRALARRPELAAATARIARADALRSLAEKARRPDLTVGLMFTFGRGSWAGTALERGHP